MKREVDEIQNEMNKLLGVILDTVDNLEDKKMRLVRIYQQAELLKKEEENIMNYYELAFVGFDGEDYNLEKSWLLKTERTYEEMLDYVHNLNKQHKHKYCNSKSYYIFNVKEVFDTLPTNDLLEEYLREL